MKLRQILNAPQLPWVLLCVLLLPFFALCFFTYPVSDDYSFFIDTQTRSFIEFIQWGYTHLSGRYTAIIITKLFNPLSSHSFWLYRLFVVLMFVGFSHSAYLFLKEGAKKIGIAQAKLIAAIMLLYWWLLMPNTTELVYWYSSSFSYTIGLIGLFYWGYFLLKNNKVMACLLPVFIAGTCELAAIIMLLVVAIVFVYHLVQKVKLPKYYYLLLASVLVFSAVALLSPGNFHRNDSISSQFENSTIHNLTFAFTATFDKSLEVVADFFLLSLFTLFIVIILAIATPGYNPSENVKKAAKYMLFGSLAIIPLLLFPYYWSTGLEFIPLRIINYAFIAFSVLYIPALFIFYKPYFSPRWEKDRMKYAVVFITLVYIGFRSNLRYAVTDLANMNTYVEQVDNRYNTLEENKGDVEFEPLAYYPNTILHMDLDKNTGHWYNRSMAKYYGVKSVERK